MTAETERRIRQWMVSPLREQGDAGTPTEDEIDAIVTILALPDYKQWLSNPENAASMIWTAMKMGMQTSPRPVGVA